MKLSLRGQACQKKGDLENQKAEAFSIEAGYHLDVSPGEYLAFVVRREIACD